MGKLVTGLARVSRRTVFRKEVFHADTLAGTDGDRTRDLLIAKHVKAAAS